MNSNRQALQKSVIAQLYRGLATAAIFLDLAIYIFNLASKNPIETYFTTPYSKARQLNPINPLLYIFNC
jgi:hypothetical protein